MGDDDLVAWTPEVEVELFKCMQGHKPIGITKHFHMACIAEKLLKERQRISPKHIWAHLADMYDLDALEELEDLPFPNEEQEFSLPSEILDCNSGGVGEPSEQEEEANESKESKEAKEVLLPSRVAALAKPEGRSATPEGTLKRKRQRMATGGSSPPSSPVPGSAKRRRV